VELAKDLIADVRRFDEQLKANAAKIAILLDEHGTRLREIDGVGPVLAARLLGRTGSPGRFVSAAAYANYTGTAPVQIASVDSSQHRLSRLWRPAAEFRDLHHRDDPDPDTRQHPAAPITTRKSPKESPRDTSPGHSNDTSPPTSGASCSPTKRAPHECLRK
jgi:hypothetical protein